MLSWLLLQKGKRKKKSPRKFRWHTTKWKLSSCCLLFLAGKKMLQLYLPHFLAKLYFENSDYCWIGVRIMALNFKNPGDGAKPSPCTHLLLPNTLEQSSLEDKCKQKKSTSNLAIWHFLHRQRREPEFSPWGLRKAYVSLLSDRQESQKSDWSISPPVCSDFTARVSSSSELAGQSRSAREGAQAHGRSNHSSSHGLRAGTPPGLAWETQLPAKSI